MSDTVTTHVTLRLFVESAGTEDVPTTLTYDPRDSHAVTLTFHQDECDVSWSFARALLSEGVREQAGLGDVFIMRMDDDVVFIRLVSPEGKALFEADAANLERFLERTHQLVPAGSETFSADALIAEILESW